MISFTDRLRQIYSRFVNKDEPAPVAPETADIDIHDLTRLLSSFIKPVGLSVGHKKPNSIKLALADMRKALEDGLHHTGKSNYMTLDITIGIITDAVPDDLASNKSKITVPAAIFEYLAEDKILFGEAAENLRRFAEDLRTESKEQPETRPSLKEAAAKHDDINRFECDADKLDKTAVKLDDFIDSCLAPPAPPPPPPVTTTRRSTRSGGFRPKFLG